ncbi:hypothetical protein HanPI659440_Chr14g0557231 [Helianthus annuus]|nr:hypothetical protein HanPI659440_Chr14g0557231 [Helianthus annuus]
MWSQIFLAVLFISTYIILLLYLGLCLYLSGSIGGGIRHGTAMRVSSHDQVPALT